MYVSDLMTENPVTIDQNSTVYKAMDVMQGIGCHHLPVMSAEHHLIGVISDHDCRRAINVWNDQWRDNALARQLLVRSVMTPAPIVVEPNAPAHEACRLMLAAYIRCLPVMRGETLVGIITTSDLLIAFMNQEKRNEGDGDEAYGSIRKRARFDGRGRPIHRADP